MRVFTYSEARQNLAKLLDLARTEEVRIRRKDGSLFILRAQKQSATSPFDTPGLRTQATTEDILDAVAESRARASKGGR
ncbi:MAG TPA: prevent-host-death protein [Marinobacter hydrocarbonoclasticus]|nr:prevent-host-death protein [Alcanivorax sp.]MBI53180.1 prevent-host-death protein [Alcanivorax sp.]QJX02066.1 prevent-host-death protein [Alcanivorax sp. IO_7]HAX08734.1 prevent-host-death protein [Marinobacter nauticus]|tara:strand:- start:259 stop:495 length:237 start_codon:yes stop_codon:yes gene_type:complete